MSQPELNPIRQHTEKALLAVRLVGARERGVSRGPPVPVERSLGFPDWGLGGDNRS